MDIVGVSEAARRIGVDKAVISRQVKDGVIPLAGRDSKGRPMISVEAAREARAQHLDRAKQRGPASPLLAPATSDEDLSAPEDPGAAPPDRGGAGLSWQKARTAREAYQAQIAQLDLEERRGTLLDRQETIDAFFELGQRLRDALEHRVHDLASRIGGMTDVAAIAALIEESDRKTLAGLADGLERTFRDDAATAA